MGTGLVMWISFFYWNLNTNAISDGWECLRFLLEHNATMSLLLAFACIPRSRQQALSTMGSHLSLEVPWRFCVTWTQVHPAIYLRVCIGGDVYTCTKTCIYLYMGPSSLTSIVNLSPKYVDHCVGLGYENVISLLGSYWDEVLATISWNILSYLGCKYKGCFVVQSDWRS